MFNSDSNSKGLEFQKELEHKAFELGGSNYQAPAQLVGDFLDGKASKAMGTVEPSYAFKTMIKTTRNMVIKVFRFSFVIMSLLSHFSPPSKV